MKIKNDWLRHVMKVKEKKENKGKTLKEILKIAKKSYR